MSGSASAPVPSAARVEELAARASAPGPLPAGLARELARADVLDLGAAADSVRRALHGNRAHLVRVALLGWTEEPAAPSPGGEAPDEVRIEGDLPGGAALGDLLAALDRARAAFPKVPLRALRPAEVAGIAARAGMPPRMVFGRLRGAGLATLHHPAPRDDPAATREGLLAAHGSGIPTDAPVAFGPDTSLESLVDLLLDLRELSVRRDRFRAAVPLPAHPPEASPLLGTTGLEDLRVFALTRLLLPGVARVAVEAGRAGPKLGAVALAFGADTLSGALAEPTARLRPQDAENPRPFNADRARRLLAEGGWEPVAPPPFPVE